jgi:hypothetical protein
VVTLEMVKGEAFSLTVGARGGGSSFRAGPSQIYAVNSAGGTQTRITHTTTQETEPAWSQ